MLIIITRYSHRTEDLFFSTSSLRQNSVTLCTLLIRTSTLSAPRWQRSKMHTTCVSSSSLAVANTSSAKQTFHVVALPVTLILHTVWCFVTSAVKASLCSDCFGVVATWRRKCRFIVVTERAEEAWRKAGQHRVAMGILRKTYSPGIIWAYDRKICSINSYLLVYTCEKVQTRIGVLMLMVDLSLLYFANNLTT